MQTIIKELALNPTVQELMLNADITQVCNQTWAQILFSGCFGSMFGGCVSGLITFVAMWIIDNQNNKRWEKDNDLNNKRWEKSTYKNFECEFWLKFYKEFHIINRFIKPFLKDMIFSNQNDAPHMFIDSQDNGKMYFKDWLRRFDELFDLVNGYEDLYIKQKHFNITHIWIIWSMKAILEEGVRNNTLSFNEQGFIDQDIYKQLYQRFQALYWNNVKMNTNQVNNELDNLWNEEHAEFDLQLLWQYFEKQLNEMEYNLRNVVTGDLFD